MGFRARVSIDARYRWARARRGETGGGGRPPGARGYKFFFLLAPRRVGGAAPHERVASRDEARRGDEAPVARVVGEGSEERVDARSTRVCGPGWFVVPVGESRVSTGGSEAEDRALERGDVDVSGRRRALRPERGAERLERARSFAAAREGAVAIVRARERGRERRGRARPGRARERTRGVGRSGGRRAMMRGRGELEGEAAPPGRGRGEPSRQPPRGGRGGRGGRAGSGGARRARRDAARGRRVPAPHRDRPRGGDVTTARGEAFRVDRESRICLRHRSVPRGKNIRIVANASAFSADARLNQR